MTRTEQPSVSIGDLAHVIGGSQAKRRLDGASNRTVNMDVRALRDVLKRFEQWRRLKTTLTQSGGETIA